MPRSQAEGAKQAEVEQTGPGGSVEAGGLSRCRFHRAMVVNSTLGVMREQLSGSRSRPSSFEWGFGWGASSTTLQIQNEVVASISRLDGCYVAELLAFGYRMELKNVSSSDMQRTLKKLLRSSSKFLTDISGNIYSNFPLPGISAPVFIIGCGRSGTTILGQSLSKHRKITYLNEQRYLWFSAFPETDIWTSKASVRNGRLFLTETDYQVKKGKKLSRLFRFAAISRGRPVVVEKLPINNFRLRFIQAVFPDARFIHIYRNGLEVARSIGKICEKGGKWYGENSYKWNMLVDYSKGHDETSSLSQLCETSYDKGLLEWRLSTEAAVRFLSGLPESKFIELSYDEFLDQPVAVTSKILDFIGVGRDHILEDFVSKNVKRKSDKLTEKLISQHELLIGGRLLELSADGGKGITSRAR